MTILEDTRVKDVVKDASMEEVLPKIITLQSGASFKVLEVTGYDGMQMPLHYSTKEAVIIVQEGMALLNIDNQEYTLQTGSTFVIPAQKTHTLSIKSAFNAIVIMDLDSKIEFVK